MPITKETVDEKGRHTLKVFGSNGFTKVRCADGSKTEWKDAGWASVKGITVKDTDFNKWIDQTNKPVWTVGCIFWGFAIPAGLYVFTHFEEIALMVRNSNP